MVSRPNQPERQLFKMRWEKGTDRAILVVQLDKKRGTVEVSRGNFPTEIYQVR